MGSGRGYRCQERPQKGLPRPGAWLRKLGEGLGHEGIGVRLQVYVANAAFLPGQACHYWLGQQVGMPPSDQADVFWEAGPGDKAIKQPSGGDGLWWRWLNVGEMVGQRIAQDLLRNVGPTDHAELMLPPLCC
jgi:hypothetical protein